MYDLSGCIDLGARMNSCIWNTFLFILLDVSILDTDLLYAEIFSSFKTIRFQENSFVKC